MKETEEEENKRESAEESALSDVIINILDYYTFKQKIEDEGDDWKKGTKYENQDLVPEDLDSKVKELFIAIVDNLIAEEKKKKKK